MPPFRTLTVATGSPMCEGGSSAQERLPRAAAAPSAAPLRGWGPYLRWGCWQGEEGWEPGRAGVGYSLWEGQCWQLVSRPLLGALGTAPGRKSSRHRHSRSPTGPAPCHTMPRALLSSTAPVPLQISVHDWLLPLPRQPCPKLESGEGPSAWELKVEFSPHATVWFCRGLIHGVPQVGPHLSSHREWLQASRMGQRMGRAILASASGS